MGLIRLLIFAILGILAYTLYKRMTGPSFRPVEGRNEDERLGRLVQDPNCHVYVDSHEAVQRTVPDGVLFFCSERCAKAYLEESKSEG
jgi:YHS domain-containing protein